MKYNKLPYRERVRHSIYRDAQTERDIQIAFRKEIERLKKHKMQDNEPPMTDKEREFQERVEFLRKLQGGIDEDEGGD